MKNNNLCVFYHQEYNHIIALQYDKLLLSLRAMSVSPKSLLRTNNQVYHIDYHTPLHLSVLVSFQE